MCEIYDSHTIFLSLCCSLRSTGAPALPTLPDAFTAIDAKIHQWAPGSFLFAMWDVDECSGWLVWRQHFYMGIFISGCFPPVTGSRHNKPGTALTSTIAQLGWIALSCGTSYSVTMRHVSRELSELTSLTALSAESQPKAAMDSRNMEVQMIWISSGTQTWQWETIAVV
jgi:hypothetical protein